jgi:hypothetical protein
MCGRQRQIDPNGAHRSSFRVPLRHTAYGEAHCYFAPRFARLPLAADRPKLAINQGPGRTTNPNVPNRVAAPGQEDGNLPQGAVQHAPARTKPAMFLPDASVLAFALFVNLSCG